MGVVTVGISDLKIAMPPDTLVTYALGSCVGTCLLDPVAKVDGLSHIMLPAHSVSPNDLNLYKFADTAIPELIGKMVQAGAVRGRLQAKIAGGAQMFGPSNPKDASDAIWQIGHRNVDAVVNLLQGLHIPIIARDVLKNYGRTVSFDPVSGQMTVRALTKGTWVL